MLRTKTYLVLCRLPYKIRGEYNLSLNARTFAQRINNCEVLLLCLPSKLGFGSLEKKHCRHSNSVDPHSNLGLGAL
jgi:hypothetical protein